MIPKEKEVKDAYMKSANPDRPVTKEERERWSSMYEAAKPKARVGVLTSIRRYELALREIESQGRILVENVRKLQEVIQSVITELSEESKVAHQIKQLSDEFSTTLERLREDSERLDYLDRQGVQSIYFRDGSQLNPGSMNIRAAIDSSRVTK